MPRADFFVLFILFEVEVTEEGKRKSGNKKFDGGEIMEIANPNVEFFIFDKKGKRPRVSFLKAVNLCKAESSNKK
jgi:hypothetical protein